MSFHSILFIVSKKNKKDITRTLTDGDYDDINYENSSNLQLGNGEIDNVVIQNPYYEATLDLPADRDDDQRSPNDIKDRENIKVVENLYYGDV